MNNVANTIIKNTELKQNTVDHDDNGTPDDTKGMGGAVALFTSDLMITNCNFYQNLAQTYNHSDNKMTTNSAAGGGDICHNRGSLKVYYSVFKKSKAGLKIDPANHKAGGFTGDGGSILVHGEEENTVLDLYTCEFSETQSYGNGGAISLSRDSSSGSRACFIQRLWPNIPVPVAPFPNELGGGCMRGLSQTQRLQGVLGNVIDGGNNPIVQ